MGIKFLDYRILKLAFTPSNCLIDYLYEIGDNGDIDLPLSFSPIFLEDEENIFFVHFALKVSKIDNDQDLGEFEVEFAARFSNDEGITEKFKSSHFPKVNAPAIAYPFLRASVNNFFTSSGYSSVLLPTYNFTKVKNERK